MTNNSFTGVSPHPAFASDDQVAAPAGNTLFVVDGGDLGTNPNAYLAVASPVIATHTNYQYEILMTPGAADGPDAVSVEVRVWLDAPDALRPDDPTLQTGSYLPSSARAGNTQDNHFGISVHDHAGSQWYFDNLKIESVAALYPHYLFRLDAQDFAERFKVRVSGYGEGQAADDRAYGMTFRLWNNTTSAWEVIGRNAGPVAAVIDTDTGQPVIDYRTSSGYFFVMASGDHPWGRGWPARLHVDHVLGLRRRRRGRAYGRQGRPLRPHA